MSLTVKLTEDRIHCVGCRNAGLTLRMAPQDVHRCGCGAPICFDCKDQIGHCGGQCDRNADREER